MSEDTTLREVLTELVALKDGPRDAEYERRKPLAWQAAREALAAASQEREPEWEYRAAMRDHGNSACDYGQVHDVLLTAQADRDWDAANAEPPWDELWIERRVKAGEWQRVDDEQPDPQANTKEKA